MPTGKHHVWAVRQLFASWMLATCLIAHTGLAQRANPDSLRKVSISMPDDTSKIWSLYDFGNLIKKDLPDSALAFFEDGKELAIAVGDKRGQAEYANNAIKVLNDQGKFRLALDIAREGLSINEERGVKKDIAKSLLNVGSEWHYLSDFQTASEYYLNALAIMDSLKDKYHQRILENNLASIFINLGQYEKGKHYAEKSLQLARELKNDYAISSSTFNIATAELYLKQFNAALDHYQQIELLGVKTNDYIVILDGWLGRADVYNAMKSDAKAKVYFEKVISFAQEKSAPEYEMYAYMGLTDVLTRTKEYVAAEQCVSKGIAIAIDQGSTFELKDLYLKAADLNEQQNDFPTALAFRKKFEVLNDSVAGQKSRDHVALLEAKFESDKKQNLIKSLESEHKMQQQAIAEKNKLNIAFFLMICALIGLSILGYRTYRQKQQLHRQRIVELEKEKQLEATEAVLRGEEQERTRLSTELHDGLGSMLSSIKMNLQHDTTQQRDGYTGKTIEMVDASIREMRRIAHNLMPESLHRFGLDTALRDFCSEISATGSLKVHYQSYHLQESSLDRLTAVTIYRVVQELVNNTIKHSGASSAIVQIANHDGNISLTVEDDGTGFDVTSLDSVKGIGWSNIKRRVELLKGSMNVASDASGTSFHLEFSTSKSS